MTEPKRPVEIVLVRHGESEANVVHNLAKKGILKIYSQDFINRHDSEYRLSKNGITQAKSAGKFIKQQITSYKTPTRFLTSPYNRTMETAVNLNVSDSWEVRDEIREREWAEASNLSPEERRNKYEINESLRQMSYYYWRAPGGESIADVVHNRVRLIIETIYRENAGERALLVTHGEFIWAMRFFLERLHPIEFNNQDSDPQYKISNCFVLQYSRRNPKTCDLSDHSSWR